jgi:gas vesicle protein
MAQNARRNRQGLQVEGLLAGLLVGGLMGAGVALLKAPRSGAEMRQKLRERTIDLRDRTERVVADAQSRADEVTDLVAKRATRLQASGTAVVKKAQTQVHKAVEQTKQAAESATKI